MNTKDLLVHIDLQPTCTGRLATAIKVAKQQQARLTGIYTIPPHRASDFEQPYKLAKRAGHHFMKEAVAAGLDAEWICADVSKSALDLAQTLNLYAHYHDVLIISQSDPDAKGAAVHSLPEKAVLGSGRPVLIVPYACDIKTIGKRVMLVWRGGPESARALHDSMPLLRSAQKVHVMSIQGYGGDEAYESHNADICNLLKQYEVNAIGEKHVTAGLSVGDMLLNRCADEGIDLLVLGAFSQSRRGTQVLGEVGRYLLESMTVPVLMSH
ncbi:universal stress protein [Malonomonas rubra]|uniref:universal stress protein n=1 Tax=Malonomonas rubra TaxID=57040 RepID=UPI0026EF7DD8|nr:universal stress protein [Malonomonas rubra]